MNDSELIPCTPELNRLKEFLASFKPTTSRRMGKEHIATGVENFIRGHHAVACGSGTSYDKTLKNYGGPYEEPWTWAGGRITPKY